MAFSINARPFGGAGKQSFSFKTFAGGINVNGDGTSIPDTNVIAADNFFIEADGSLRMRRGSRPYIPIVDGTQPPPTGFTVPSIPGNSANAVFTWNPAIVNATPWTFGPQIIAAGLPGVGFYSTTTGFLYDETGYFGPTQVAFVFDPAHHIEPPFPNIDYAIQSGGSSNAYLGISYSSGSWHSGLPLAPPIAVTYPCEIYIFNIPWGTAYINVWSFPSAAPMSSNLASASIILQQIPLATQSSSFSCYQGMTSAEGVSLQPQTVPVSSITPLAVQPSLPATNISPSDVAVATISQPNANKTFVFDGYHAYPWVDQSGVSAGDFAYTLSINGQLWFGGSNTQPSNVYATDLGNPESTPFYNEFVLGRPVIGLGVVGEGSQAQVVCFHDKGFTVISGVGPSNFVSQDFLSDDTLFDASSVQSFNGVLYYLGKKNFYAFDGSSQSPVGDNIAPMLKQFYEPQQPATTTYYQSANASTNLYVGASALGWNGTGLSPSTVVEVNDVVASTVYDGNIITSISRIANAGGGTAPVGIAPVGMTLIYNVERQAFTTWSSQTQYPAGQTISVVNLGLFAALGADTQAQFGQRLYGYPVNGGTLALLDDVRDDTASATNGQFPGIVATAIAGTSSLGTRTIQYTFATVYQYYANQAPLVIGFPSSSVISATASEQVQFTSSSSALPAGASALNVYASYALPSSPTQGNLLNLVGSVTATNAAVLEPSAGFASTSSQIGTLPTTPYSQLLTSYLPSPTSYLTSPYSTPIMFGSRDFGLPFVATLQTKLQTIGGTRARPRRVYLNAHFPFAVPGFMSAGNINHPYVIAPYFAVPNGGVGQDTFPIPILVGLGRQNLGPPIPAQAYTLNVVPFALDPYFLYEPAYGPEGPMRIRCDMTLPNPRVYSTFFPPPSPGFNIVVVLGSTLGPVILSGIDGQVALGGQA